MQKIIKILRSNNGATLSEIETNLPSLQPDELLIKNSAVSIEDLDIIAKNDPNGPDTIGHCGAGVIESVGENVRNFTPGDKVAYIRKQPGALATHCVVKDLFVVGVPSKVTLETAAALFYKACIAHAFSTRLFIVRPKIMVLIHDASRPQSKILAQYCHLRKATKIIGTLPIIQEKNMIEAGLFDLLLDLNDPNWGDNAYKETDGGVHITYDCIGKSVIEKTVSAAKPGCIIVSYGNTTGNKISSIPLSLLQSKSLFYTVPNLFHYKDTREEIILTAIDAFEGLISNNLMIQYNEYSFTKAQDAIASVENRSDKGNATIVTFNL